MLIALSGAIAAFLLWIHAPAALMLGPLIAGIVVASSGGKVKFPLPPFVLAQGIVGCLIASMVPLSIVDDVLRHWVLFGAGVLLVVAVSSLLGWMMTRLQLMPGTTALWGTSAGAASVMTIMAEHYGADPRLVAFMQYLRVVMVAAIAALVARLFGVAPTQAAHTIVWFPQVAWLPLAETLALAIAGPIIARRLRIPAGAFLVPLVLGILLTHFGLLRIELPTWLLAASYAFVGWNVGLRFTRPLLVHALKALPVIFGATFVLIALCGAVAVFMVWGAGVDPLTAYLATSPGGSDS
ncbi:MAG: AbrB family transcriptional regulator, partial [Reyranella sp.]|nr:AbrB family transcriptional regulator [Reyranella sp.]